MYPFKGKKGPCPKVLLLFLLTVYIFLITTTTQAYCKKSMEWVAIPFSRGSSWPRGWTHVSYVSCTAGGFFIIWATKSPRILEWVAYPFSSGSSHLRNGTGVPCISCGFFTNWAIREALNSPHSHCGSCKAHSLRLCSARCLQVYKYNGLGVIIWAL